MEAPLHPVSCDILGLNILQEAANSWDTYDLHHSNSVSVSSCQSTDDTLFLLALSAATCQNATLTS